MAKSKADDRSKYQNWIDPHDVTPYERNAKEHTEKQIRNIANSIRRYGWQQDTVITTDKVLVIGHGRRLAALQLGCLMPYHTIDKTADEVTDEDIRELRIADNQTNAETGFNWDILKKELEGLNFDGFDFDFDLPEDPTKPPEIVEDTPPEPPAEPITKPGDIWQLGEHRLYCGDSALAASFTALMRGEQADLLLTDPPYNVNYEDKDKAMLERGAYFKKPRHSARTTAVTHNDISNDNMSDGDFRRFLTSAFQAAYTAMRPGAAFYIWHADSEGLNFRSACVAAELQPRQCLIWVKNNFVLGRQDYQWKHEPCLYGWKGGTAHYFTLSRSETTVIPDAAEIDPHKMKKEELIALLEKILSDDTPATVIHHDMPHRSSEHPTMKPVGLFDYLIRNSSKRGDIVLDSFAGSGTTVMACEQDGRRARCIELSPKYCDVIIQRWEKFTGRKAEKIEGTD